MTGISGLETQATTQTLLARSRGSVGGFSAKDWHIVPRRNGSGTRARVIFWLGRPGSGKTTLMRALSAYFRARGYTIVVFDDFHFLLARAQKDARQGGTEAEKAPICLTNEGGRPGFLVRDFSLLAQVLVQINTCMRAHLASPDKIIMVEFARSAYLNESVWGNFDDDVLMSAHYIFCDAALDVCTRRVQERRDHVVPAQIMASYYATDGLASVFRHCPRERIEVIDTNGSVSAANQQITSFRNRFAFSPAFKLQKDTFLESENGLRRESGFVNLLESYNRSVRG